MKPEVWGPHAWIFLHSITFNYPDNPTDDEKKHYKNFFENLKFDIALKKISKIKEKGKISFIISSYAKNCGFKDISSTLKCKIYKPLISTNLIN